MGKLMIAAGTTLLWALLAFLVGFFVGGGISQRYWKSEAVDAGAAYYDCAQDTGKCEFTWRNDT